MYLNKTTEYALRVMVCMATKGEGPHRASDLSETTEVPSYYLSKILKKLVKGGLLTSSKGHGGGFTFAKPLSQIRYLDIFAAVGFNFDPEQCVFGWGSCATHSPCPLHQSWSEMIELFHDWAKRTSLASFADLAPLQKSLTIEPPQPLETQEQ